MNDLTPEQHTTLETALSDLRAIGVLTGPDGSAMPCASGGLVQALAPVVAQMLATERERIAKAIEAVGEFDAYLATAPMVRIRAMHAHDVRTAVSIARQEPTS